jgi:hypothetical protein
MRVRPEISAIIDRCIRSAMVQLDHDMLEALSSALEARESKLDERKVGKMRVFDDGAVYQWERGDPITKRFPCDSVKSAFVSGVRAIRGC